VPSGVAGFVWFLSASSATASSLPFSGLE
jgi:hypothetical protein